MRSATSCERIVSTITSDDGVRAGAGCDGTRSVARCDQNIGSAGNRDVGVSVRQNDELVARSDGNRIGAGRGDV